MDNLRELLGLRRRVSIVNVVTCVQRPTSDCLKVRVEEKKEGPKPSRRRVTPEGWAVGLPYSAATARTRLRRGGGTQRLCAALSSRPRSHVPTHCSFSRAGSPAPPWVAGSPVAFLVATPWWPPAASLPVWTFCGAQYLGKAATLVPSRWSFARRLALDTSLEQCVGRLSHDRTTVRHWQSPTFAPEGYSGTPRQPAPRLLGQLPRDYLQSLSIVEVDQAGAGDSRCIHSRPVQRVVGTVG